LSPDGAGLYHQGGRRHLGGEARARRENIQSYIRRLEKLEEIANSFGGVEKSFAIQAGREVRIMVKPEAISDDDMTILARDLSKKIENELEYPARSRSA
jgi:ribonuclease Y